MRLSYDRVGDILYLNIVEPYREQESDMISDTVIVRTNPDSGRVENLQILFFSELLQSGEPFDLPIGPDLVPDWDNIDAKGTGVRRREPRAS